MHPQAAAIDGSQNFFGCTAWYIWLWTMRMTTDYQKFIESKSQVGGMSGFEPLWIPSFLFDFQQHLVDWSIRKGRAAIIADCGLGKTPMQLVCGRTRCERPASRR